MDLASRALEPDPGLAGFVGVDLILDDREDGANDDRVVEINPRLTTSYVGLRALSRDNLAACALRLASGAELPPLVWQDGVVEFTADGRVDRLQLDGQRDKLVAP